MATQTVCNTILRGDVEHDVCITFEARMVFSDYGVPGSPFWWQPEDIEAVTINVDDVDYSVPEAERTFGEPWVTSTINALSESLEGEWEEPEPDDWGRSEPWEDDRWAAE